MPPNGKPGSIAPSLLQVKRGVGTSEENSAAGLKTSAPAAETAKEVSTAPYPYPTASEPGNPTVVPEAMLKQFHFAFLIRHPKYSIPSYYRCTIPPLDAMTGFYNFMPSEAGYSELRRFFDYLRESGQVGPTIDDKTVSSQTNGVNGTTNGTTNGHAPHANICVVDADDLLDRPADIIETFCKSVGMEYTPDMLNWDNEEDHQYAKNAFEKWKGFHEDAIHSSELKPREHVSLIPYLRFRHQTDNPQEEGAKDQRGGVCGMEGKVRRGGRQGDSTDRRRQCCGLRVPEAIRHQDLG